MTHAIDAQELSFAYEATTVLKNVSFRASIGEYFVIIGPNGSGKTTLLKLMAGLLKVQSGRLKVFGQPVQDIRRRALARTVAIVPQVGAFEFPFRVGEFVLMGRAPHQGILGLENREDLRVARQAMTFTGVEHLASRRMDRLSGGERQRVVIARAVCQQPRIILLDEPTAFLDLAHQAQIMDLMERLRQENGVTVVMVSHDVNLASMFGSRLLLLAGGNILAVGKPEDVIDADLLERAYGCRLIVDRTPATGTRRVTLLPKESLNRQPSIHLIDSFK
jgi:iron complex transport system ATP-binding protein